MTELEISGLKKNNPDNPFIETKTQNTMPIKYDLT